MKLTFALVSVGQFVTDDLVVVVAVAVMTVEQGASAAAAAASDKCYGRLIRTRRWPGRCRRWSRFAVDDCCSLHFWGEYRREMVRIFEGQSIASNLMVRQTTKRMIVWQ